MKSINSVASILIWHPCLTLEYTTLERMCSAIDAVIVHVMPAMAYSMQNVSIPDTYYYSL